MKVLDRYLGEEVDLPESVMPSQYRLLKSGSLNGDIELVAGQVLFSDGRDDCCIGSQSHVFQIQEQVRAVCAPGPLVLAVAAIAQHIRTGGDAGLSPLMPPEVGGRVELTDLDHGIAKTIPHLCEIDRRPRVSMHYEAEIAPVSRAKRVASTAITHLASHSEDWHRRTLSWVQPKRILALFSEDEWVIYENRIFARLLDRLDRHLQKRLADLGTLEKNYKNTRCLSESTCLDHRLRTSLFRLWGDAFSADETSRLLDEATESIAMIKSLRRQVRVLRQGKLYNHVPRNANVLGRIRDTNILRHDTHYRHLRTLWPRLQKKVNEERAKPAQIYDRNQCLFEDYTLYVGMLARRVLAELTPLTLHGTADDGGFRLAGSSGQLRREMDEWVLEYDGTTLTIVPALFPVQEDAISVSPKKRRIPVFLFSPNASGETETLRSPTLVIVNPLEFYGLERMRYLIESFLWRQVFSGYRKPIRKLPSEACAWLSTHGFGKAERGNFEISQPVWDNKHRELESWLFSAPINENSKSAIRQRILALQTMAACRACGRPAHFEERSPRGFNAHCKACSLDWGIFQENGLAKAKFNVAKAKNPSFETHGAWILDIDL